MPCLRRIVIALTALMLIAASHIASMASVMEAAGTPQIGLAVPVQSDPMPGCSDCGRDAVPANACAMHCTIPPSDIASPMAWGALPPARPTPARVLGFEGRAPAPDLHPPRVSV